MNLQKKLIQLSTYKCSFKYVESYFLVSMTYPSSWSIIPSEDRTIEVAEEDGVTFYAAPIETNIENAFALIDDTIAYNLDVEKKMNLLKFNINKLQELFAEKDLQELETLEFTFKQKKETQPKQKKKSIKKKTVGKNKELPLTVNDMDYSSNAISTEESGEPLYLEEYTNAEESVSVVGATENKYLEIIER